MADNESTEPVVEQTEAEYKGLPGRTRKEAIHYTCDTCGYLFGAGVYSAINVASDPELGEQLSKGDLNTLTCPSCSATTVPNVPVVYHDPAARTFALLLPESMRHLELEERARVITSLVDDPSDIPDYVRRVDAVFGTKGLLRLLDETLEALAPEEREDDTAQISEELDAKRVELERKEEELLAREEDLQAKQEDVIAEKAKLEQTQKELASGWKELDRERTALRALSIELQAREDKLGQAAQEDAQPAEEASEDEREKEDRAASLGRPEQEVERWLAGEEPAASLSYEGMTFLLGRPDPDLVQLFADLEPELWVQLFELPEAPLLTLVAIPSQRDEKKDPSEQAIYWLMDPAAKEDRVILDQLAEEFSLSLDIYNKRSRRVATWEIHVPLSGNVRHLLARADKILEQQEAGQRDFSKAVEAYGQMGEGRLGRKQHNFSSESFREMPSPAASRLALGIVSYWSERENEDYLIQVKSFPLTYWRAIRERVVRKALEFGLRLSPQLSEFAIEQKLATSRQDLLRSCVSNFAEVSLRIKPSDLDPAQELENWKLLLADCVADGVRVDVEIEELAAAAAKRAGVEVDERAPGGDLSLLSDDELLPLLADRSNARDVALELCERGGPKFIEPVYRAVCNMTRAEVARVVPAMLQMGPGTTPFFIRGLKHRKSFIRQGCALALGAMKAEAGIKPLMEMLLGEPTNVWKEASRALGDLGNLSLGALVAGVKAADAQGRERLAWALSQTALVDACLVEVEAMAKGRDAQLTRVAGRALQLMHQVRNSDQEVRGGKPLSEQTIVRSFSRQFFESMTGEVSELDEDDILEQEEMLDDSDILEEEVEVSEEDILNKE